jgi:anti-sigma factor RsiW
MSEQHPDFQRLLAWVEGELPPADMAEVAEHVAQCSTCRLRARRIRQALRVLSTAAQLQPSLRAREHVIREFGRQRAARPGLRGLTAVLASSSQSMTLAPGLRMSLMETPHWLYTTPDIDLTLTVRPTGEELLDLAGQVLWPSTPPAEAVQVLLLAYGQVVGQATATATGEFTLAAVPAGTYTVVVLTPDVRVEVPQVLV